MAMKKLMSFIKLGQKNSPLVFPEITLTIVKRVYGGKNFASPSPDITETVHDSNGNVVGQILYTISPLKDRIYLFEIEVDPLYRRRGFGLASLVSLAKTHDLPMTVVHPISPALLFWETAQKELSDKVAMTQSLSINEMDKEKTRWNHFQPEIDKLEKAIAERFVRGEPYEQAVGRGFEE
jgi:hypothetical protein